MLEEEEVKVVERPDNIEVKEPSGLYSVLEPFQLDKDGTKETRICLMILNQRITRINLRRLWRNSELHVCADGGADRLYHYFGDEGERAQYIPDFITGDLDSISSNVRKYYQDRGTIVIPQYTQYASDFMKAIALIELYYMCEEARSALYSNKMDQENGLAELKTQFDPAENYDAGDARINVYIIGGINGRFDQTVHSISQIYCLQQSSPQLELYFITGIDLIFLLKKGTNYIKYPSKTHFDKKTPVPICGLLPLGNTTVKLTTHGLKYDVTNWPSLMVGNVSSSNGITGTNGFIVTCSDPIVMNIAFEHS